VPRVTQKEIGIAKLDTGRSPEGEPPDAGTLTLRVQLPLQNLQLQPNPRRPSKKMPSISPPIDIDPDAPSGLGVLAIAILQQEKSVPEKVLRRIPAETMSASDLIIAVLPKHLQGVLRSLESCLSKRAPDWTAEHLWKTCIPPRTWLSDLDTAVDREWASGICSIEVPTGNRDVRFPLWIGNFWLEMVEVMEQREKWKRAQGWMLTMLRGPEIQEAEKLWDRTPWGLRLWPLVGHDQSTRVGFLAGLLSNDWLAELQKSRC